MKRAKISSGENCDFISKLPSSILRRILGLLSSKQAVQTCMLSKRWEHLWTSLPSLNFNFDDDYDMFQGRILTADDDDDDDFGEKAASRRFVKFVSTLLLRRKPLDLDVFRLSCDGQCPEYARHVKDWILYAVNHNTRVLHLTLYGSVPCCIYTCTLLEELYLDNPRIDSSVQMVNLPNLRKLSIGNADLNSSYVKNLLSGCTILEFLWLDTCSFNECIISHECLKHLAIVNCVIKEIGLFVNTPNLLSFSYSGEIYKTTLNMPSLRFAYLVSCDLSTNTSMKGMASFFSFLINVEILKLNLECGLDQELSSAVLPLELPIFPNLKKVSVAFVMFSRFQMVTSILKSSPNLMTLTIVQQKLFHDEEETTNTSSTIDVSLCKKLEIVVVKYWRYDKMVQRLVDSLMDGTNELENLKMYLSKYKSSM